jgi:hypothetical protein
MDFDWRFCLAVGALTTALTLCWWPFSRAVAVLRPEAMSLRELAAATAGDLFEATSNIDALIREDLPDGLTLRTFVSAYDTGVLRTQTRDAAKPEDADRDVAALDASYQRIRAACLTELVCIRFDKLKNAIRWPGSLILLTFMVFAWAANPGKDGAKVIDKPYFEPVTPARIARLRALGAPAPCLAGAAQLLAVAAPEPGHEEAILSGPQCAPQKVLLSAGDIFQLDAIGK